MADNCCNIPLSVEQTRNIRLEVSGDGFGTSYELPTMSGDIKGGAKLGEGLTVDENERLGIEDGGVSEAKLGDGAVTSSKLADGAVTTDKLDAQAVDETKLADSAVTGAKLADNAVTSSKLSDGAVTLSKLASDVTDAIDDFPTVGNGLQLANDTLSAKLGAGMSFDGNGAISLSGGDIESAVSDWLDAHPEATTTVQDGSITDAKLVQTGGVLSKVNNLDFMIPVEETPLTANLGHYIRFDGYYATNSAFYVTDQIELKTGDLVKIYARGYLNNSKPYVAILSKYENGAYTPKVVCIDNVARWYLYEVDEDGLYVVSGDGAAQPLMKKIEHFYSNKSEYFKSVIGYTCFSLFEKFGVVGDSFASGYLAFDKTSSSDQTNRNVFRISWPQILARKSGTTATNYSYGGLSTRTWLTSTAGLSKMQSNPAEDLYILALGINDTALGTSYIGTISDITSHESYVDYPDTFYGNYGKIIEQIKEYAPNSGIVISTMAASDAVYNAFNNAIIAISEHYEIPLLEQRNDTFFMSSFYKSRMVKSHPTAPVYSGMANAFERMINNAMLDNYQYFRKAFVTWETYD